jgi:hypothetical protein
MGLRDGLSNSQLMTLKTNTRVKLSALMTIEVDYFFALESYCTLPDNMTGSNILVKLKYSQPK